MKTITWLLLAAMLLQCPAEAGGTQDKKAACETVKKKIRGIEAKMRNGYTAAQGIRYDESLRKLRKQRYELCRK